MTSASTSPTTTPATGAGPLLSLRGVNKSFGAVNVLQNVDFDAYKSPPSWATTGPARAP